MALIVQSVDPVPLSGKNGAKRYMSRVLSLITEKVSCFLKNVGEKSHFYLQTFVRGVADMVLMC